MGLSTLQVALGLDNCLKKISILIPSSFGETMLLRTKLHGKTYEFPETGGFDTPFATTHFDRLSAAAQGYSTTEITKRLEDSFVFLLSFVPFVSFVVKK